MGKEADVSGFTAETKHKTKRTKSPLLRVPVRPHCSESCFPFPAAANATVKCRLYRVREAALGSTKRWLRVRHPRTRRLASPFLSHVAPNRVITALPLFPEFSIVSTSAISKSRRKD